MAIKSSQVTVTTSPTFLAGDAHAAHDPGHVTVAGASAAVFLGGPDVTTSTGVQLGTSDTLQLPLSVGDALYAIASAGTPTVQVLETRA